MPLVKKYTAEVVIINPITEDTFTIGLRSQGRAFKYQPGQFLHLALDPYDPSAGWPESRCFSMQSPPGAETLKITYTVKGRYTSRMAQEVQPGRTVSLKLPFGDLFTRAHSKNNTVFIAGGTGITPYLSLLNAPAFAEYSDPVLHAGFRTQRLNAYETALEQARTINPSLTEHVRYQDRQGMLDIAEILEASEADATFFISGPPQMIAAMKQYLLEHNTPEDRIRTDDWE